MAGNGRALELYTLTKICEKNELDPSYIDSDLNYSENIESLEAQFNIHLGSKERLRKERQKHVDRHFDSVGVQDELPELPPADQEITGEDPEVVARLQAAEDTAREEWEGYHETNPLFSDDTTEKEEKKEDHSAKDDSAQSRSEINDDCEGRFFKLCMGDNAFSDKFWNPALKGDRSDREFHLCAYLYEHGFTDKEIYALMTENSPQKKWNERGVKYRWGVIKKAIRKVKSINDAETSIDIGEVGRLNLQVELALDALREYNEPPTIFRRSNDLCQLEEVAQDEYAITKLNKDSLRPILSSAARWCRNKYKDVYPPAPVVDSIYKDKRLQVPWLNGFTNTPIIRDDGSIFDERGFDSETSYYYIPDKKFKMPEIPENPTKEDARKEAQYLMTEIFSDFPFVDEASKTNALAGLITPIARALISGQVPLYIVDKPTPGTGASLLIKIFWWIAKGTEPKFMTEAHSEEEWKKKIFAALYNGDLIICVDNLDGDLKSSALSSALTSPIVEERILGQSKMGSAPNNATWYATGNQTTVAGDLARRSYHSRIDAKTSRPWERDPTNFRHPDILLWTRENRGSIIAAILTMIKAWIIAGKPEAPVIPMGSFEQWSSTIGGILHYAGIEGFRKNAASLYENIATGDTSWEMFLQSVKDKFGTDEFTANELLHWLTTCMSDEVPEEIDLIMNAQHPSVKSLGKRLQKKEGRIFDNGLVIRRRKGSANKIYYKVEKV